MGLRLLRRHRSLGHSGDYSGLPALRGGSSFLSRSACIGEILHRTVRRGWPISFTIIALLPQSLSLVTCQRCGQGTKPSILLTDSVALRCAMRFIAELGEISVWLVGLRV